MYVPASTYRLQIHHRFDFAAAAAVAGYLARLGVASVYTSPYFTASPGSEHGYDISNHNEISPEIGGAAGHDAFTSRLSELGLGHVLDFVPNHMGIGTGSNTWWRDVLENGPSSAAARFFDIDWTPATYGLASKLLLPILGDQYGRVLERGELNLRCRDGQLVVTYFEQELPINPVQAPLIFRRAVDPLTAALGADHPQLHEFMSIVASLQNLPVPIAPATTLEPAQLAERQREKEVARARLSRLAAESEAVAAAIAAALVEANGDVGRPSSFDALHELLEAQAYRVAYWRTASNQINYRRFFDINDLAGLRVEDPEVFAATHALLRDLLASGKVQGLRIDHPDGLFDPKRYFAMLRDLAADALGTTAALPLYVVAEKILSRLEEVPGDWPVCGTTGYGFLNDLNGLFVNAAQARRMRRAYARLTGRTVAFTDVLYESKRLIMETAMASELTVLGHAVDRIAAANRRSRDFTLEALRDALTEVVACFPAYRTYVDELGWTAGDRAVVERAVDRARRRNPAMESSLFDFLREIMLPRGPDDTGGAPAHDRRAGYPPIDAADVAARLACTMRFQQYTGPVQAKGLEDTAFYRYNALLSLNEVGGDVERFGRNPDDFHAANARRLATWPHEMLATATHDTKLGEDVRARINVLSERPDEWAREAARWMRVNRSHRALVEGEPAPDRNDEYRFYQALLGAWPAEPGAVDIPDLVARLQRYMNKAVKEAKLHTSWLTPNQAYEEATARFVERVLQGPGAAKFLPAFAPMAGKVARAGMLNALSQLTLKLGAPGVPDFYQGSELWDLSLVDPDNRRPVDFALRARLLDEIDAVLSMPADRRGAAVAALMRDWRDGRIKMLVTAAGLRLRRDRPALFARGGYQPLDTDGHVHADVVAFARTRHVEGGLSEAALFIAPRLCAALTEAHDPAPLGGAWKISRILLPDDLGARTFTHLLTGARLSPVTSGGHCWLFAGQVFDAVPAGILLAD